jgi:hypothetical protein
LPSASGSTLPAVWTTPAQLRTLAMRRWDSGEILRSEVSGETLFPIRLRCALPGAADLATRFNDIRRWIAALETTAALRIEWKEVHHRIQGRQRIPACVWVEAREDLLDWIGKAQEFQRFAGLLAFTRAQAPGLLHWLGRRPLEALAHAADWEQLLDVVAWIRAHPRPGIYLRQVDLAGIHSKFIEWHRGILSELLDASLPADAIDRSYAGAAAFAPRYGFRSKPLRIRFRPLDPGLRLLGPAACPDVTLDHASFAQLSLPVTTVILCDKKINFLALPELPAGLAVFGAGYGWDALADANWLHATQMLYWGDIDTHGFAILDQLRACFGHAQSLLMDRATLEHHRPWWDRECSPFTGRLDRLTADESDLLEDLRHNRLGDAVRLEQERIRFSWVRSRLAMLDCPRPPTAEHDLARAKLARQPLPAGPSNFDP